MTTVRAKDPTRRKILFLITSRYTGGAEQSLRRLIEHVQARYDCRLAAPYTAENQHFLESVRAICPTVELDTREPSDDAGVHLPPGRFFMGCWRTLQLLWRTRPDVVIFFLHLPLVAAAPRFVLALLRWKTIVSFRLVVNGLPVGPRRIRLLNWEKRRNQTWVAVSGHNRRLLCEDMHLEPDAIRLIYNGLPPLDGTGRLAGEACCAERRRLGLPEDRVIFLFCGRLTPIKGCRELVDAAVRVWRAHPEVMCVLLGDGPDREVLAQWIQAQKAEAAVLIAGAKSEVRNYLAVADVYVHPSHAEGLSNSLLEAMQMGLPVIAADCSSMPELVTDQQEGLLVSKSDPAALASAMERMSGDARLREQMGQAARRKARQFPLSATLSAWDQLLSDLL